MPCANNVSVEMANDKITRSTNKGELTDNATDKATDKAADKAPDKSAEKRAEENAAKQKPARKYPCGNCSENIQGRKSLMCAVCELWFHYECIDGITTQLFDCCDLAYMTFGFSSFFCKCCKKATGKLNGVIRELREDVAQLKKRMEKLEKDRENVLQKVSGVVEETVKVKEGLQGVEREVTSGMEKAKEAAKVEMKTEMEKREKSENLALYGIPKSAEEDGKKRVEDDKKKVEEMMIQMGVAPRGEVDVRFRAGRERPTGDQKPRPLIITVEDDETREEMKKKARNLSKKEEWKRVFVGDDLTYEQREMARKEERENKLKAEQKKKELLDAGETGKFIVVGRRGSRRIIRVD